MLFYCSPYAVLQIVRREGLVLWQELQEPLFSLSSKGPAQVNSSFSTCSHCLALLHFILEYALGVVLIFSTFVLGWVGFDDVEWLFEDITIHNEDLEGLSWTALSFLFSLFWGWVEMWNCVWVHTHVDFSSTIVFLYAPLTLVLNVLHRW